MKYLSLPPKEEWDHQSGQVLGYRNGQVIIVKDNGMSVPNSRKGSLTSLYPEVSELLTRQENGRGVTSYDLISRTLHQLARDGNSELLASALERLGEQVRRRINHLDGDRLAPLHYAARYAHTGTVKTLINAGAHVNIKGQDNLTPLHFAARYRKQLRSARRRSPLPPVVQEDEEEEEEKEEGEEEGDGEEQEELEPEDKVDLTITSFNGGGLAEDSIVRILVESGAEINAPDIYGQTPLHYASMRGNDPSARDLLMCPLVDIEAKDKQNMTPLFVACSYGYVDITRRLIDAGAILLAIDETRQTPLHRAAMEGHTEIVDLLLNAASLHKKEGVLKGMVEFRDLEDQTPLHLAVQNGHLQVSKRLLEAGAEVDAVRDNLATPLHAAAAVGDIDLIYLLLDNKARLDSVDGNQQTALHRAAAHNQSHAIVALLEAGAVIERRDKDSFTPLLVAACNGHANAISTLLEHGAEVAAVDKDDRTPIFWCAEQGFEEALKVLLQVEACEELIDISDRFDDSPLHKAAKSGHVAIIKLLLDAGSQIDNKNEDGETALHVAAENGKTKVVRELVQRHKLLIPDENEEANTALHLACLEGQGEVVKVLLEFGAEVEARNTSLWTPLDCAAAKGHVYCVHLLLDYDAPLDPLDKTKTTPLQLAAREGHVAVTKLLLERGASLAACDASGRNALEQAIVAGRRDVCMAIVKSQEWETGMRNVRLDKKGRRITPFRMLVRKFPDVAEAVLDRCTSTNNLEPDDKNFEVNFSFDLLDDTYTLPYHDDITSIASSLSMESPFDEDGLLFDEAEPYTSDARELKDNHPLMMMVKYKRLNLLSHPVAITLVKHKWMSYGRIVYYSTLIFYLVFLTFLTGYVLTARNWTWVAKALNDSRIDSVMLQAAKEKDSCADIENEIDLSRSLFVVAGKWVIVVMVIINIMREMFQIYQARLNYIGLENLLEWCCYVTAGLLVWDFNDCAVRKDWQWQVGAASIFLAWMNLLLFIRKLPFLGIFVVMFTDIFATFLKFSVVFFLFIVAFALSFYLVLRDQPSFATPGESLIKTSVMMIGEFEFDSIFHDNELQYPEITYILFVALLILMSIIIMNLLVGLAVDDIKAVQDQAILKRLAMQTQMVLDVEVLIPEALRRMYMVSKKGVHPNARHGVCSRMFGDFQIINSFDFVETGEQMNEHEIMRRDMTQMMTDIRELRTQNQRLHSLLIALVHFQERGGETPDEEALRPDLAKYL